MERGPQSKPSAGETHGSHSFAEQCTILLTTGVDRKRWRASGKVTKAWEKTSACKQGAIAPCAEETDRTAMTAALLTSRAAHETLKTRIIIMLMFLILPIFGGGAINSPEKEKNERENERQRESRTRGVHPAG